MIILLEADLRRGSAKEVFLIILLNLQENICTGYLF